MAIQKGTLIIGGDNLYVCVLCMDYYRDNCSPNINRTGSYSIEGLYKVTHKGRLYIEEGKRLLVPLVEDTICCSSQGVGERKKVLVEAL